MLTYIIKRILTMIPVVFVISIISFIIIVLPPGDFMTSYLQQLQEQDNLDQRAIERVEALRDRYGLEDPVIVQYFKWFGRVLQGDLGFSFSFRKPVITLIWDRLGMTLLVTLSALLFTWVVAFPIGFYSAVRHYSFGDYFFSLLGFLGLAIPNFLLALVLMYLGNTIFDFSVGGLFSPEFVGARWSFARFFDLLEHLWVPTVVVGTAGTAGLIRVMRNNLLDELSKPYVTTARAKGVPEWRLILKYPVRRAINPFLSMLGFSLPQLISGAAITSVVLSLPTAGSMLVNSLLTQDMYLAGAIVMMMAVLTVIGTLLSDILLALVDPRIRFEGDRH